jgi:hypothetical protein
MPRQIIILERLELEGGWKANVAYWADVPENVRDYYANENATSAVKDATLSELGAIRDGAVRERVETVSFNPAPAQSVIDATLIAGQAVWQDQVNTEAAFRFSQYGRSYDGSAWNPQA